jgi:Rieske 2Fe-2S family protein
MPVRTRVIGGLIFVCLSDDAPADIAVFDETMTPRLEPYDLSRTKIAFETDIIENGNWKLAIENNRECYHCGATHPELTVSFLAEDFGFCPDGLSEESERALDEYRALNAASLKSWEKDGLLSSSVEQMDNIATLFRTQRLVIAGNGESQTMNTKVASTKLLGNNTRRDLGDTHLWTHSSWSHFMSDHAVVSYLIPLAPDRTLVRTKWLVHEDAVEGVDYSLSNLIEVWQATNAQDARLVEINHQGTQDPGYRPGPFSPFTESYLERFSRWYAARLEAHGL